MEIKVAIVDTSNIFRKVVATELAAYPNIEIVFEAEKGIELLSKLKAIKTDIILLELAMPHINGLETLKELRKADTQTKVLIITKSEEKDVIVNILLAGANGYVLRDANSDQVHKAIKTAIRCGDYYNDRIHEIFLENMAELKDYKFKSFISKNSLTEEELQIVQLIYEGKKSKEIGIIFCKSKSAIDKVRTRIYSKTETKNSAELVKYAITNKLIDVE